MTADRSKAVRLEGREGAHFRLQELRDTVALLLGVARQRLREEDR
jgi:hypothetical protein